MTGASDETGIIVAGVDRRGHAYVLEDLTGKFGPHDWATRAIAAYDRHKADRIIGEANNGGLLIQHTLRTIRPSIPFRAVHASRGRTSAFELSRYRRFMSSGRFITSALAWRVGRSDVRVHVGFRPLARRIFA